MADEQQRLSRAELYDWVWSPESRYTSNQRTVLSALLRHADARSLECYPSLGRLVECTGLGKSTVARTLKELSVRGGPVKRTRRPLEDGRWDSTRYALRIVPQWDSPREGQSQRGTGVVPERDGGSARAGHEPSQENHPSEPSHDDRAAGTDGLLERFDGFWDAYPPRSGNRAKKRAREAWKVRRQEGHEPEAMIAAARRYHRHQEAAGNVGTRFVMMAATFLNDPDNFKTDWKPERSSTNGGPPRHPKAGARGRPQPFDYSDG